MSDSGSRGHLDLGEVLLQSSRLGPEQLAHARTLQEATQARLSEILVEEGILSGKEVLAGIGEQLGLEVRETVDVSDIDVVGGDTGLMPRGAGTYASRITVNAGSSVRTASAELPLESMAE